MAEHFTGGVNWGADRLLGVRLFLLRQSVPPPRVYGVYPIPGERVLSCVGNYYYCGLVGGGGGCKYGRSAENVDYLIDSVVVVYFFLYAFCFVSMIYHAEHLWEM